MPKYKLSALEYECTLLREFIKEQERECEMLEVCRDLYDPDIFSSVQSSLQSIIESFKEKLVPLEIKLQEFRNSNTADDKYYDDEPLEYLYQIFLTENLHAILRKIEIVYENTVRELLDTSHVLTKRKASKITSHIMRSSMLGYLVSEYIMRMQIQEMASLPCYIRDSSHAIDEKYRYFMDRISCCLEIGNKLRDLERY